MGGGEVGEEVEVGLLVLFDHEVAKVGAEARDGGVINDGQAHAVLAQLAEDLAGLARAEVEEVGGEVLGVEHDAAGLVVGAGLDDLDGVAVAAQQRLAGTLAALWDDYGPARADGVAGSGRPGAPPQVDDERWHRLQAGIAVTELLAWAVAPANPYDDAHSPADVLLHVRFALAHRWDAFEDALAAHLEDRLG